MLLKCVTTVYTYKLSDANSKSSGISLIPHTCTVLALKSLIHIRTQKEKMPSSRSCHYRKNKQNDNKNKASNVLMHMLLKCVTTVYTYKLSDANSKSSGISLIPHTCTVLILKSKIHIRTQKEKRKPSSRSKATILSKYI